MKSTDQILKIAEIIIDKLIWQQLDIDEMQFIFKSVCGTINAILILTQRQEKYLAKQKNLYFVFAFYMQSQKHASYPLL